MKVKVHRRAMEHDSEEWPWKCRASFEISTPEGTSYHFLTAFGKDKAHAESEMGKYLERKMGK